MAFSKEELDELTARRPLSSVIRKSLGAAALVTAKDPTEYLIVSRSLEREELANASAT
jgi:hypothetical protein